MFSDSVNSMVSKAQRKVADVSTLLERSVSHPAASAPAHTIGAKPLHPEKRIEEASMCQLGPGPGAYQLPVLFGDGPALTFRGKLPEYDPYANNPGPNHYNSRGGVAYVKTRPPAYTLVSRTPITVRYNEIQGPAAYKTEEVVSFAHSNIGSKPNTPSATLRARGKTLFEALVDPLRPPSPGPNAYKVAEAIGHGMPCYNSTPAALILPRREEKLRSCTPGPNNYTVTGGLGTQVSSMLTTRPQYRFPKTPRDPFSTRGVSDVGPGEYTLPSTLGNSRRGSSSHGPAGSRRSSRSASTPAGGTRAPGAVPAYLRAYQATQASNNAGATGGADGDRGASAPAPPAGPSYDSYKALMAWNNTLPAPPGFVISGRREEKPYMAEENGPAAYSPTDATRPTSPSYSLRPKGPEDKLSTTPGPTAYSHIVYQYEQPLLKKAMNDDSVSYAVYNRPDGSLIGLAQAASRSSSPTAAATRHAASTRAAVEPAGASGNQAPEAK